MRTDVSQAIIDAFDQKGGVGEVTARINGAKARHFVTSFEANYAASFADSAGIIASPLPQDGKIIGGRFISVYAYSGELWLSQSFGVPIRITSGGASITCDTNARPAIVEKNASTALVFYVSGTTVYSLEIDLALLIAGTAACVSLTETVNTFATGKIPSLQAVSSTLVSALYVDDGGVKVAALEYTGAWGISTWDGRFMFPGDNYQDADTGQRASLNFSGAAALDGKLYTYLTGPNGNVVGVYYDTAAGTWSDSFEAISSDLSKFAIGNTFIYNEKIYLAGQFQRVDENSLFTSTFVYGLLLVSADGETFNINRFCAFTGDDTADTGSTARRWLAGVSDDLNSGYGIEKGVVYSDANNWAAADLHYGLDGVLDEYTIVDPVTISGNVDGQLSIRIPGDRPDIFDLISLGDALDIQIGALTENNRREFYSFMRCIVARRSTSSTDGSRSFVIDAAPWTYGLLDEMTHPMTLGLAVRESLHDDLDDLESFERATDEGYVLFPLVADFWDDGGKVSPAWHTPGIETEIETGDLMEVLNLTAYPVIEALPFDIKCYGWSRSGQPTPEGGGTGDQPSDLAGPNDAIHVKLYIERDGVDDEIEVTISDVSASGTYDHFPQTWYATANGDYPVILEADTADGLAVGDTIKQIGLIFSNTITPNNTQTTYFPERVEIPSISMKSRSYDETWKETTVDAWSPCVLEWIETSGNTPGSVVNEFETITLVWAWTVFKLTAPYQGVTNDMLYAKITMISGDDGINAKIMRTETSIAGTNYNTVTGNYYSPSLSQNTSGTSFNAGDTKTIFGHAVGVPGTDLSGGAYFNLMTGYNKSAVWRINEIGVYNDVTEEYTILWDLLDNCPQPEHPEDSGLELMRVGVPVVYFADKPYYSINCQVGSKVALTGEDARGGVVALASDGNNYIAAKASTTGVELIKVRAGLETSLGTGSQTWPTPYAWISLRHLDGNFEIRVKDLYTGIWSDPLVEYSWTEDDGALLIDEEVSHVGLYGLRDAPYARICGLDLAVTRAVGLLPTAHMWSDFPASGTIRIEDCEYTYSAKVAATLIMGPYQGRNTGGPYSYSNDGASYSGAAAEITRFEWVTNSANKDDFDDEYLVSDNGVAWEISAVDYKPFIYTAGSQVFLKNRSRWFSSDVEGDLIGMAIQCWITHVLTGLALTDGEPTTHAKGTIAYVSNDCTVKMLEFNASSGHDDLTDKDAIAKVCALAGGEAAFPGDVEVSSKALSTTAWEVVA